MGNDRDDAAVWRTLDPDGREVVLPEWKWAHVMARHPYIGVEPRDLLDVVAAPDRRTRGPKPAEE